MKHTLYTICCLYCMLCFFASTVHASYMLPYPSTMPGNKIYKVTRIIDRLKNYWYVGDIAQVKYHLQLADKYLVEAKTLMEYQQYLLGQDALIRSNNEFLLLKEHILKVEKNKKNASDLKHLIAGAADTHIAVLTMLQDITPASFTWTPEKSPAVEIQLHNLLTESKNTRISIKQFTQ